LRTADSSVINVEFYRFLSQSTLRLKAFATEADVSDSDGDKVLLDLLTSPVLHNVHCLRLDLCDLGNISGNHIYEGFVKAIAKLPALETLKLIQFPLHADWIQYFRNSLRLKSVRWDYRNTENYRHFQRPKSDLVELEDTLGKILARSGDEGLNVRIQHGDYVERRLRDPASEVYHSVECDSEDEFPRQGRRYLWQPGGSLQQALYEIEGGQVHHLRIQRHTP
jgi:hypothetical protein